MYLMRNQKTNKQCHQESSAFSRVSRENKIYKKYRYNSTEEKTKNKNTNGFHLIVACKPPHILQ